jgi:hypothetical protein
VHLTRPLSLRNRTVALVVAFLLGLLTLQAVVAAEARAAEPRMYQDQTFAAGTSPTEDKPQSKLWFHDGFWWALMRTNVNGSDGNPDVTVHQLQSNHTWLNTGTVVDGRAASTGDAMWEGGKLYVASRVTNGNIQAARLSYNATTKRFVMDSGFPKAVTSGNIESVTIARDSLGRIWVTFTKPHPTDATLDQVWVAHSTTNDTTWTAPFLVPVSDNVVRADDISAIVTFAGKVGVMYSDQQNQRVYFAVHPDSAADDTGWTLETALSGTRSADDHLNLKSLLEDDGGRVYAAIKTSRGDAAADPGSDPSIRVLSRSSTGTWTATTAATVSEGFTRPQLSLDATNKRLYVVMSTESGGSVYYRNSPLGATLSFTPRATLLSFSGALINNATTAKAPVTAASGLVVVASDERNTNRYFHAELDLGGGSTADSAAPSVPTGVNGTADSSTQVTVRWTASTDNVGVASYQVKRGGTVVAPAATGTSFVDTTVSPSSTYTYTVSAVDAAGNRSADSTASPSVTTPGTTPTPGGAITVAGTNKAQSPATVTTSVTIPKPATGVAAGDVLIAQINADDAPTIAAAGVPAGWAEVIAPLAVGTSAKLFVYYKVVGASEPANYTWTLSTAVKWNAVISSFHGVNTSSPFDTPASTRASTTVGTAVPVTGVTTTTAGAMLVGGVGPNNGGVTVTPPSGWTESNESTGAQATELAYQARPTAGATGNASWTLSAGYGSTGWLRALRPAA